MGVPARLSMVTLMVKDIGKQRAFYRALGWEEQEGSNDEHAMFKTVGGALAIFPWTDALEYNNLSADTPFPQVSAIGLATNLNTKEEVDAAFETVRAAGARIIKEPQDVYWGGYTGLFADPEGNIWEIAYNPYSVFDERGALIV
jgi:hypothetical protein